MEYHLMDFFIDVDSTENHLGTKMMEMLIRTLKQCEADCIILSAKGSLNHFYESGESTKNDEYTMTKDIRAQNVPGILNGIEIRNQTKTGLQK